MTSTKIRIALLAALSFAAVAGGATTASAAGCNGTVSQFEWGCAAWDNNNGPQFPHYKAAPARQATPTAPVAASSLPANGKLVASGGGNLVASGGGNLVASGGGNLVASGGGNLVASGGGNVRH